MSTLDQLANLPPSVQLARLHAQAEEQVDFPVDASNAGEGSSFSAAAVQSTSATPRRQALDLTSELAFPSLGGGSVPRVAPMWGSGATSRLREAPVGPVSAGPRPSSATGFNTAQVSKTGMVTEVLELPPAQQQKFVGTKNITADVVKTVKYKTETDINVSTSRAGTISFLIKGRVEDVARAKRELVIGLAVKTTVSYSIPSSVRRYVIGAKGSTLKAIEVQSATVIRMPPRPWEEVEPVVEDDGEEKDEMMDVSITGDPDGIKIAKAEIEKIVNTSKRTIKLTHFDPQYYPFIAGANNKTIDQLAGETSTWIQMPLLFSLSEWHDGAPAPSDRSDSVIVISGEREGVQRARERIEEAYENARKALRTLSLMIPKRQHRYLVAYFMEVFETTGCVIELPPSTDPSEQVTIRGAEPQLIPALQIVMEKANSIHVETLDLATVHPEANPQAHARNMLKYLINRNRLRKVESDTGATVGHPLQLEKGVVLEFVSKNREEAEEARKQVFELAKTLTPSLFGIASVEPNLHRHVIGKRGQNINRIKDQYGVDIIVPDEADNSADILIVYEGKEGEPEPGNKKAREARSKQALDSVCAELVKLGQEASYFTTQTLAIPIKYHRTIIGAKGATLNDIVGGPEAPVSVKFGSSRTGAAERSATAEGRKEMEVSEDTVLIRGPTEEVNRVAAEIKKIFEEAKQNEIVNSYTTEFNVPIAYSSHVIGKSGANINRLKEQLEVRIDIDGGKAEEGAPERPVRKGDSVKVLIQGSKKNVETAKERILDQVANLADQMTLNLNIPAQYHRSLIGLKGRYVKRLEEKYSVFIKFPRDHKEGEGNEADEPVERQRPDEVVLKGGKKGVEGAKGELLELLEWEKEHGNVITFTFAARHLPHVVGKAGSRVNEIKDETETRIDFSEPHFDSNSPEKIVTATIQGTKQNIAEAKKSILTIVGDFENQTTEIVRIDPAHHKFLIGQSGTRIRDLVIKCGGPSDRQASARMVNFPRPGTQQALDEVVLKGDRAVVERIKAELEREVAEQNSRTRTIQVPRKYHRAIAGTNQSTYRRLRNELNVVVDHGGEPEPKAKAPKPKKQPTAVATPVNGGGARIGDAAEKEDTAAELDLPFEIVENEDAEEGEITWHFKGEKKNVEKAEKIVLDLLEETKRNVHTHTGYLAVPQHLLRHVIGRGGSTISRIRDRSGCRIDVPHGKGDEIIVLTGTRESLEEARTLIIEVLERSNSNGTGRA